MLQWGMKSSHASPFSLHPHLPHSDTCQYPISLFIFHIRQNGIRNGGSSFLLISMFALLFFRPSVGSCDKWEKIRLSCYTYLSILNHPPLPPSSHLVKLLGQE
ncbi:hypothetical protein CEXT_590691 [Caerostris extrusa]|uniref:Uncharacterized protein n=1 Tax=Caerostris extrusa TaxID=172846 RepID=A0AAV4XEX4_CAEEX|nr:hypothetical protein CEXT_590691 [Caerostris extrusa]